MADNIFFQLSGLPLGLLIVYNPLAGTAVFVIVLSIVLRQLKIERRRSKTANK